MANVSLKKDFVDGEKLFAVQLNNNFGAIEAALGTMNKIVWQDDDADSVVTYRGTTEEIEAREIINGQLLYNIETGETFIDYEGERTSTGSGNVVYVGDEEPENDATKLWVDTEDPLNNIGTEVVDSLDGNEHDKAPSVNAVNKLNYIFAGLSVNWDTDSLYDDYRIVPIDVANASSGDKLTFDSTNHCIVIGAGVKQILACASVYFNGGTQQANDAIYMGIIKNNKYESANLGIATAVSAVSRTVSTIINVVEGDKIYLGAVNKTRAGSTISANISFTHLKVTVLK